ncbi:MAG: hypothetical protein M3134_02805 [Actinomycetota bacterium]|nr:hypothetical protein [Actinomycetota bacterium]
MSRLLRILSVVCVLVVLPVQPAQACSCFYGDPRDRFQDADGAFVGTFVESHPVEPNPSSSGADTIYTFVLDEEHKGELGEEGDLVEVHAPLSGASCGIEASPGEQYGIFLQVRESDGAWASSLCSQVSPETLREGASPLPAPTSNGPVRFVAGGSFGDMQTVFLDADGKTVGYGSGDRDVTQVSGCRGRARILEVGRVHPGRPVLVVRDVSSLDVVRSVEIPAGRSFWVAGVHCLTESGRRSAVFVTNHGGKGRLLLVDGDDVDVVYEATAESAAFHGRRAYLEQGRDLVRVSLRTGAARQVATLPGDYSSELVVSPDGTELAGVAYPPYDENGRERPAKLFVVDLASGRVPSTAVGSGERSAHVRWLSRTRIVMFVEYPDASRVYDADLEVRARFGRWPGHSTAIVGRTAYGVDYDGGLWSVELPNGTPELSRRLPSPVVYDLTALE